MYDNMVDEQETVRINKTSRDTLYSFSDKRERFSKPDIKPEEASMDQKDLAEQLSPNAKVTFPYETAKKSYERRNETTNVHKIRQIEES